MKSQTIYVANDGKRFDKEEACAIHDEECMKLTEILSRLYPRPENDGCSFENGDAGYIQHKSGDVLAVREGILGVARRHITHKWLDDGPCQNGEIRAHPSWVARLLSDSGVTHVSRAWWRICCIDHITWREYGQPFYVTNPDKCSGEAINIAVEIPS